MGNMNSEYESKISDLNNRLSQMQSELDRLMRELKDRDGTINDLNNKL